MQNELSADYPSLNIDILAINQLGAESGIASISSAHHLPIVNDESSIGIWSNWGGVWRDVFILNQQNEIHTIYNLTQHNLAPGYGTCSNGTSTNETDCQSAGGSWTENYDQLKQLFIDAATQ